MNLNNKNRILISGTILMLLLSYKLAIQKTFDIKRVYNQNIEQKQSLANLPEQLSILSQKEQFLDKQLSELNIDDASMQNNLLKFLNKQTLENNVNIIDFNAPHIVRTDNELIETYIFSLEGGYTNILKTLNAIENTGGFGSIGHIGFEKKKNYRSKKTYLRASVFLEQVR